MSEEANDKWRVKSDRLNAAIARRKPKNGIKASVSRTCPLCGEPCAAGIYRVCLKCARREKAKDFWQ